MLWLKRKACTTPQRSRKYYNMNCSQSIETRTKFLLLVLSPVRQRLDTKVCVRDLNDLSKKRKKKKLKLVWKRSAMIFSIKICWVYWCLRQLNLCLRHQDPMGHLSPSLSPLRPSALRQTLPCCFFNRNSVGSLLKYVLDLIYNIQFGF